VTAPTTLCFLAEWYQPDLAGRSIDDIVAALGHAATRLQTQQHPIQLMLTVISPADEMLYSVFTAESVDAVTRVCSQAGWPVDRITCDVQARIS
jgi:hypothetical protein